MPMLVYSYGANTDRGDVRSENQDSILCLTGTVNGHACALFVAADGMGGLSYGSQVSRFITEQFARWWREDFPQMMCAGRDSEADIKELLEQEIWDINQSVLRFKEEAQCRSGSTLSLLLFYGEKYFIKNMGDSRIYRQRAGILERLTEDQSLVAQLVREGRMTEKEACKSGKRNILTMCIGMFQIPQSFYASGQILPGDCFLVCSDGLYNPVGEEKIAAILGLPEKSTQTKAGELRRLIGPGEASDNVSVIVAEASRGGIMNR